MVQRVLTQTHCPLNPTDQRPVHLTVLSSKCWGCIVGRMLNSYFKVHFIFLLVCGGRSLKISQFTSGQSHHCVGVDTKRRANPKPNEQKRGLRVILFLCLCSLTFSWPKYWSLLCYEWNSCSEMKQSRGCAWQWFYHSQGLVNCIVSGYNNL